MARARSGLSIRWPDSTKSDVFTAVGLGLVGLGAVLPWVDGTTVPVQMYVLGTATGLELLAVRRLLLVVGVGVAAAVLRSFAAERRSLFDAVLVAVGAVVVFSALTTTPTARSIVAPASGLYLTVVGGTLVALGAVVSLLSEWE